LTFYILIFALGSFYFYLQYNDNRLQHLYSQHIIFFITYQCTQ